MQIIVRHVLTKISQILLFMPPLPLAGASLSVGDELLATGQRIAGTGVSNANLQGIRFTLGYGDASNPIVRLFAGVTVTETDLGRVFVADQTSDPSFLLFSSLLTNGIDDLLLNGAETVVPAPPSQGAYLQRRESVTTNPVLQFTKAASGPDLSGYRINRVEMEVLSMTIDSPGRDPNDNGRWSDYSGNVEFRVFGAPIPEPEATTILLVSAVVALSRRRRL